MDRRAVHERCKKNGALLRQERRSESGTRAAGERARETRERERAGTGDIDIDIDMDI